MREVWNWFRDRARSFFNWINDRTGRTVMSVAALLGIVAICMTVGGIVATACLIMLAVYVGILITLNRMRRPPPEDANFITVGLTAPFRAFANFMFRHRLLTTIAIGALASSVVGFATVTGLAVGALSAFAGDLIVTVISDITDWIRDVKKPQIKTTEVQPFEVVKEADYVVKTA